MKIGEIVRSLSGHDQGNFFYVVNIKEEFVYLTDGKHRKIEHPKKKRMKHVISSGLWTHPVTGRIQSGTPVLDSEIRRALAAFRDRFSTDQGGMTLG
ncbi:MAG: KOW domain-containing RNA-binding protein [Evtepia sp.]